MNSTASPPLDAPRRPDLRFALSHPAHCIALGFGSGLSPVAPGTAGTLFGWASFVLLSSWLGPVALATLVLLAWPVGWWACSVTARDLQRTDPGVIVWDEIAAFWLVLWLLLPAGWLAQCAAFALFRLLDAVKPQPVAWADGLCHPRADGAAHPWWRVGFGILFDDLVAAFCALVLIALVRAA